jgi:hypothetical protein
MKAFWRDFSLSSPIALGISSPRIRFKSAWVQETSDDIGTVFLNKGAVDLGIRVCISETKFISINLTQGLFSSHS